MAKRNRFYLDKVEMINFNQILFFIGLNECLVVEAYSQGHIEVTKFIYSLGFENNCYG